MKKLLFALATITCSLTAIAADKVSIVTEEYPPYNLMENGKIVGLSTEIVNAAMKKTDLEYTIELLPWARAYDDAQKKPNTAIYSMSRTDVREKLFQWVDVVAPTTYNFYALKSKKLKINSLDDAKKYKNGTVLKDITEIFLQDTHHFPQIQAVNDHAINIRKLYAGNIDLILMSDAFAKYIIQKEKKNFAEVEAVFKVAELSKDGYYMAFSPSTPKTIVDKVKKGFEQIRADKTYDKILEKFNK